MNSYLFTSPVYQPLNLAGERMPGAYLQFFLSQTDTPTPVYGALPPSSSLGPEVDSDSDGVFPPMYMDPVVTYRVKLFEADDTLVYDVDPYTPPRDYPTGTVMWFFGTEADRDAAYPPALWQVCDGSNGTPDGRDRVPVMAGGTYVAGDIGGAIGSITTSDAGAHDHGGVTGETTLDSTQMPTHHHRLYCWIGGGSDGEHDSLSRPGGAGAGGQRKSQPSGGSFGYATFGNTTDSSDQLIEDSGSGSPVGHTHAITGAADHSHTIDSNLPPYLALWAVMRRAV